MKRSCLVPYATAIGCAFAAAIVAGVLLTSVPARADISVRVDIGSAPPAPHFVFRARPHEQYFPEQRVYIVDDPGIGDYDCFRYGGYYWVFRDGYWYRSAGWRGRFVVVQPRYVPAVFYRVPPTRWKHHPSGPPAFGTGSGGPPPQPARRGDGRPPQVARPGDSGPPAGQPRSGSWEPAKKSGGPPGLAKKSGSGPPGQAKKDAKGKDKGGGRGGK